MSRKRHKKKTKVQDGISVNSSGMGSSCDNTTSMRPGSIFPISYGGDSPFTLIGPQRDQYWSNMYRTYWEAKKIVDIPAGDMTREGWEYTAEKEDPDKLKELKLAEEAMGLPKEVLKALKYRRLYGGGLVFLGLKGDSRETTRDPVEIDKIQQGDLTFVRALPSFRVSATNIDPDPLSPYYQRPEIYTINGQEVHRTRFLVFDGDPIDEPFWGQGSMYSDNAKLGFGESVLTCLYSEIQDAQGSRQSVAHLLHKLSVAILKKRGVRTLKSTQRGNEVIEEMSDAVQMMSNFKMLMLDAEDSIENYSSNANTGEGLIIAYLQVLSAASDIPATRFLGQAPGGLNATGESDLRNYYDRVSADQRNDLALPLTYSGQILSRSIFGKEIDSLTVSFNPLWQTSEKEQAEIREIDARTINSLVTTGVMIEENAQKELLERKVVLNELTPFEPPEDDPLELGLPPIEGAEEGVVVE